MNKELTPLQALNDLIDYLEMEHYTLSEDERVVERKQIIETALKENEQLKTSYLENLLNEQSKEYIYKKLKALEIIKNKTQYFIDFIDIKKDAKTIYMNCSLTCDNEEYELLKEVLL